VVFSGGEPLLRSDIFELISFTKEKGLNACLTSNGILLDENIASKLHHSGINVVNISIEGPPDIHDFLRGEGSFKRAIAALENLRRYNIESTIATVVTRYNYEYLEYIIELAKKYCATTVKFQPFSLIFVKDKEKKGENFFLSKEESVKLREIIDKVIDKGRSYGIALNPYSYLKRIPYFLAKESFARKGFCKALWTSCAITSKGEVYPCWGLMGKEYLIGKLTDKRLFTLWSSLKHNIIRKRIEDEGCPGCMMSCYDDIFDETLYIYKRKDIINGKGLDREKLLKYIDKFLNRWLMRFRFYISYRGYLKNIFKRGKFFLIKPKRISVRLSEHSAQDILKEIKEAKQLLEEARLLI
jgi:radical SAM protein with 4Fe4S-binding SPASM domain